MWPKFCAYDHTQIGLHAKIVSPGALGFDLGKWKLSWFFRITLWCILRKNILNSLKFPGDKGFTAAKIQNERFLASKRFFSTPSLFIMPLRKIRHDCQNCQPRIFCNHWWPIWQRCVLLSIHAGKLFLEVFWRVGWLSNNEHGEALLGWREGVKERREGVKGWRRDVKRRRRGVLWHGELLKGDSKT